MRTYRNLIAIMIVVLVLALMLVLSGCMTTYEITKNMKDGSSIAVSVQSFREFEQPTVTYMRDSDSVEFTFGAESATTGSSPIEEALADGIRAGAVTLAPIPQ
jgi:hypothetical protein